MVLHLQYGNTSSDNSSLNALEIYVFSFFFFNDTATTEIYTLSLHDALPISILLRALRPGSLSGAGRVPGRQPNGRDRKSTRLNSSHLVISYAVFCLKKNHISSNHPTSIIVTQDLTSIMSLNTTISISLTVVR